MKKYRIGFPGHEEVIVKGKYFSTCDGGDIRINVGGSVVAFFPKGHYIIEILEEKDLEEETPRVWLTCEGCSNVFPVLTEHKTWPECPKCKS